MLVPNSKAIPKLKKIKIWESAFLKLWQSVKSDTQYRIAHDFPKDSSTKLILSPCKNISQEENNTEKKNSKKKVNPILH